jgi:hypothetical protein
MIRLFIEEVPLDKNRRLIRNYSNTFTGALAVDTLEGVLVRVFPERLDRTSFLSRYSKCLNCFIGIRVPRTRHSDSNKTIQAF